MYNHIRLLSLTLCLIATYSADAMNHAEVKEAAAIEQVQGFIRFPTQNECDMLVIEHSSNSKIENIIFQAKRDNVIKFNMFLEEKLKKNFPKLTDLQAKFLIEQTWGNIVMGVYTRPDKSAPRVMFINENYQEGVRRIIKKLLTMKDITQQVKEELILEEFSAEKDLPQNNKAWEHIKIFILNEINRFLKVGW